MNISTQCIQILNKAGFAENSSSKPHDTASMFNLQVGSNLILEWELTEDNEKIKHVNWKCKLLKRNETSHLFTSHGNQSVYAVVTYEIEYVAFLPLYPDGHVATYAFLSKDTVYDLEEKTCVTWTECKEDYRMKDWEDAETVISSENDEDDQSQEDDEEDEDEEYDPDQRDSEDKEYDPDRSDSEAEALDFSSQEDESTTDEEQEEENNNNKQENKSNDGDQNKSKRKKHRYIIEH